MPRQLLMLRNKTNVIGATGMVQRKGMFTHRFLGGLRAINGWTGAENCGVVTNNGSIVTYLGDVVIHTP